MEHVDHFEPILRQLERRIINDNLHLIVRTAKSVGSLLINLPAFLPAKSKDAACFQRYIYVPLLYKLGFTKEASDLNQITFEYLFPEMHSLVLQNLYRLFGTNYLEMKNDVLKMFDVKDNNISYIHARVKSTQSIWKKVESIEKLQKMSSNEFAKVVSDFIAIRWIMKVQKNENRYDALLDGIRLAPIKSLVRFRNQQIEQESGFSLEPVMKLYYSIQNFPVELQLLGGDIEPYLCAKGYVDYKVSSNLSPQHLTKDEENARLGLCIYYAENNLLAEYRKMMLEEITSSQKISYATRHSFLIDDAPNNPDNKSLYFSGCDIPIYRLGNYQFDIK